MNRAAVLAAIAALPADVKARPGSRHFRTALRRACPEACQLSRRQTAALGRSVA